MQATQTFRGFIRGPAAWGVVVFLLTFSTTSVIAQGQADHFGSASGHLEPAAPEDILPDSEEPDIDALLDQSLETLASTRVTTPDMNFEVTTVARSETSVGKSPNAIFVITQDMIRRSGARTLPDVLRMVPGMHVARLGNGFYAIGMRGQAEPVQRDMLVQIDGRSIYNRSFGGTYWSAQDVVLEDVERIEVIRGPGGSVWGANAVRGVINIVTKCSCRTQGWYLESVAGTEFRHSETLRYGGKASWGHYRVWGKGFEADGGLYPGGEEDPGFWTTYQGGFQADVLDTWFDKLTIQGGVLDADTVNRANIVQPVAPFQTLRKGGAESLSWYTNVTGTRQLSDKESVKVRSSYYSMEYASEAINFKPITAVEFDFQHNLVPVPGHSVVWGLTFRNTMMQLNPTFAVGGVGDADYEVSEYGWFFQDTIELAPDVALTAGTRLSYNDFSYFEHQPSARIVWSPTEKVSLWTGVSRAVATPNFLGTSGSLRLPPVATTPVAVFPRVTNNPHLHAEDLLAVEVGARGQPNERVYWDVAAYHFTFRDVSGVSAPGMPVFSGIPGVFDSPILRINVPGTSEVMGFECYGKLDIDDDWQVSGNYTFAHNCDAGSAFPNNSVYLQSSHDLTDRLELDLIWRYRDNFGVVSAYNTADVRMAWKVNDHTEFSLVGMNLLRPAHFEGSDLLLIGTQASAVQRGFYGMLQMRY